MVEGQGTPLTSTIVIITVYRHYNTFHTPHVSKGWSTLVIIGKVEGIQKPSACDHGHKLFSTLPLLLLYLPPPPPPPPHTHRGGGGAFEGCSPGLAARVSLSFNNMSITNNHHKHSKNIKISSGFPTQE